MLVKLPNARSPGHAPGRLPSTQGFVQPLLIRRQTVAFHYYRSVSKVRAAAAWLIVHCHTVGSGTRGDGRCELPASTTRKLVAAK
jgi:hypothetical protein